MPRYEEYKIVSPFWGWVILWGISLFIVGYGMMLHFLVLEGPRYWDFYSLPTTPADSEYSTRIPPPTRTPPPMPLPEYVQVITPPLQIEPLPSGIRFPVVPAPVRHPRAAASEGATP